jgi:hypothetical protein
MVIECSADLMISGQNPDPPTADATDDDSSNAAGLIKKPTNKITLHTDDKASVAEAFIYSIS